MKRYNGLQAVYMSFFSKDLYRDVVEHWKGIGFLYLLLWALFISVIVAVTLQFFLVIPVTDVLIGQSGQLPNMTFTHSELSIDKESPYQLKDKNGNVGIVFDTRDNPEGLKPGTPGMLVTKTAIIYQTQYKETKTKYDEMSITDLTITRDQVKDFFQGARQWFSFIIFAVMVPSAFIFLAIQAVIYAAIGMIFSNIAKANLTYGELMRLTAIALTPVLVLDTGLKLANMHLAFWPLLSFVIALGYLFFGVKANAEKASPAAQEIPPSAPAP